MRSTDLIADLERETAGLTTPWQIRTTAAYARLRNRAPVNALLDALIDTQTPLPIMLLLGEIVGTLPYPVRDAGNIALMKKAWLQWARHRKSSAQNNAN